MSPPTPTTANHRIVNSWFRFRCIRLHMPGDLIPNPITNCVALHPGHNLSLKGPQALQYAHNICPGEKGLEPLFFLDSSHTTTSGAACRIVSMQALSLDSPRTITRRWKGPSNILETMTP